MRLEKEPEEQTWAEIRSFPLPSPEQQVFESMPAPFRHHPDDAYWTLNQGPLVFLTPDPLTAAQKTPALFPSHGNLQEPLSPSSWTLEKAPD